LVREARHHLCETEEDHQECDDNDASGPAQFHKIHWQTLSLALRADIRSRRNSRRGGPSPDSQLNAGARPLVVVPFEV
jgi:hypothetical protein